MAMWVPRGRSVSVRPSPHHEPLPEQLPLGRDVVVVAGARQHEQGEVVAPGEARRDGVRIARDVVLAESEEDRHVDRGHLGVDAAGDHRREPDDTEQARLHRAQRVERLWRHLHAAQQERRRRGRPSTGQRVAEPRARLDYVAVTDAETLEKLDRVDDRPTLVALAAYVGKTRLIDNMILNKVKKKDVAAPQ